MPAEYSAGAIIFREDPFNKTQRKEGKKYYLLLNYPSNKKAKREYWDLPKGHIEKDETLLDTIKREVFEETGLKELIFFPEFKETIKYFFRAENKIIFKTVVFFLAKTNQEKVTISLEHKGFKWLPLKAALKQLTFKNAKSILKKAADFLNNKNNH